MDAKTLGPADRCAVCGRTWAETPTGSITVPALGPYEDQELCDDCFARAYPAAVATEPRERASETMADMSYDREAAEDRIRAAVGAGQQPSDEDLVMVAASDEAFTALLRGLVRQMERADRDYPLYPEQAARAGTDILEHLAATEFNHAIATGPASQLLTAAAYLQDAVEGIRLALAATLG